MEKQEELFNEFKEGAERKKGFGKELFPQKVFTIALGYEKLILAILCFIIILVVTFAFGFERGKRSVFARQPSPQPVAKVPATYVPPKQAAPQPKKYLPQPTPTLPKPYTIQVATFKSKEYALQEVEKLRKRGFLTTLIGINGLYVLTVGEYSDQKEASQTLSVLRKTYGDCEIRKR